MSKITNPRDLSQGDPHALVMKLEEVDRALYAAERMLENARMTTSRGEVDPLRLQQTMLKQNQAYSVLSNIIKTQNDVLKAAIQNMR